MSTLNTPDEADARAGLSRRSLIRTGAVGGTSIAIVAATPAMALAASGDAVGGSTALVGSLRASRSGNGSVNFTATITNIGTATTTGLTATLTLDFLLQLPLLGVIPLGQAKSLKGSIAGASASSNWAATKTGSQLPLLGDLTKALTGSVTFRFVAPTQLPASQSTVLTGSISYEAVGQRLGVLAGTANPGTGTPAILAGIAL